MDSYSITVNGVPMVLNDVLRFLDEQAEAAHFCACGRPKSHHRRARCEKCYQHAYYLTRTKPRRQSAGKTDTAE